MIKFVDGRGEATYRNKSGKDNEYGNNDYSTQK